MIFGNQDIDVSIALAGQNGWIDAGWAESCWVVRSNVFGFRLCAAHYQAIVQVVFLPDFLDLLLVTESRSFSLKSIICV
jgi:hypothetical protein